MIYLFLTSLLWGLTFSIIKLKIASFDPYFLSFVRLFLASLFFLLWPKNKSTRKGKFFLTLLGTVQFGLTYILYIQSYSYLPVYKVAFFTILEPLHVYFVDNILYRWKPRPIEIVCIVGSILGVTPLIKMEEFGFELQGFFLVQSANFCFALGQVIYKRYGQKFGVDMENDGSSFFWFYLGGTLMCFLAYALFGREMPSYLPQNKDEFFYLLFLGIAPTGIGCWMWIQGLKRVRIPLLAIFNNLKIPFAVIFSSLILHESIDWSKLLFSVSLFFIASYGIKRSQKEFSKKRSSSNHLRENSLSSS